MSSQPSASSSRPLLQVAVCDVFGMAFYNDEAKDWGTGCNDGLDEDLDGWIDGGDPDCVSGDAAKQTEVGLGTTACNDGVDQDADGKIDAADERCADAGDNIEN